MRTRRLLGLLLLGVLGCTGESRTAIRLTVDFDRGAGIDQLVVQASPAEVVPEPVAIPEVPAELTPGVRVVLLCPDEWSEREVAVAVAGRRGGVAISGGETRGTARRAQVVDLPVSLCLNQCAPGDAHCVGDGVRRCVRDGPCARWTPPEACPAATPFCSGGACALDCADECDAGARRCVAGGYQVCGSFDSDSCREWSPTSACGPGESCQAEDGQCVADCGGGPCFCDQGETQPCEDIGACRGGLRRCQDGRFGACEWQVGPQPEVCNGQDDDCSGAPDDGLIAPPCARQQGVCAGAVARCGGEAGWLDCTDDDYQPRAASGGSTYEPEETLCDGRDNDCDGQTDEPASCCQPSCGGQACGADDGCGHRCLTGSCSQRLAVCDQGRCVCQPSCSGKVCGADDGCGAPCQVGSCGGAHEVCQAGSCVCQPSCSGKACGADDGCGAPCQVGSCGGAHEVCQAGSCVCQPSCSGRACGADDGCGRVCQTGSCGAHAACVSGSCQCSALACDSACCASGEVCHAGACCTPSCGDRICGPDPVCAASCGTCTAPATCNQNGRCITGPSWTIHPLSGVTAVLSDIHGTSASDIWAVGAAGVVLHYGGASWTVGTTSSPEGLLGVWAAPGAATAVGVYSTILDFVSGSGWDGGSYAPLGTLYAVWGSAAGDRWAVGREADGNSYGGMIRHFNGTAWTSYSSPTDRHLYDVWGTSATNAWAVGDSGTILHLDTAGWLDVTPDAAVGLVLESVHGCSPSDVWAVGDEGGVIHYDGAGWTRLSSGTTRWLKDVFCAGPGDVWMVGERGTLLHHDSAGFHAASALTGQWLYGIWGGAPDDIWAVGGEGTMLHYH